MVTASACSSRLLDKADRRYQGGVARFPFKFESGVMRALQSKDGQLYLAGLSVWQSNAPRAGRGSACVTTGKPLNMPANCTSRGRAWN